MRLSEAGQPPDQMRYNSDRLSTPLLCVAMSAGIWFSACAASDGSRDVPPATSRQPGSPRAQPSASAAPCAGGVFTLVPDVSLGARKDLAVVRQRVVRVDMARLESMPARVTLNLFDDQCLVALKDSTVAGGASAPVWSGKIAGTPDSSVSLVLSSGTLSGSVTHGSASYQIRLLRDDLYLVSQVDTSKYPPELPPATPRKPPVRRDPA